MNGIYLWMTYITFRSRSRFTDQTTSSSIGNVRIQSYTKSAVLATITYRIDDADMREVSSIRLKDQRTEKILKLGQNQVQNMEERREAWDEQKILTDINTRSLRNWSRISASVPSITVAFICWRRVRRSTTVEVKRMSGGVRVTLAWKCQACYKRKKPHKLFWNEIQRT